MLFFRGILFFFFLSSSLQVAFAEAEKGIIFHCERVEECAAIAWQLTELKKEGSVKLALITSSSMGEVLAQLRSLTLENSFDVMIAEEKQPAGNFYSHLLELLDLPPSKCVAFEESQAGILAASEAGLLVFAVSKEKIDAQNVFFALRSYSDLSAYELLHAGMEIKIMKEARKLEVWERGNITLTFPIGIGKSPLGHKEVEGDFKTPEGEYLVCFKNPDSKYHLSIGLNYPNKDDARIGREKGLISEAQYESICRAHEQKKIPLWDTALGGEIFIHGNFEDGDGSLGCIRMYENDIELLYSMTPLGTKVVISP